MIGGLGAWFIGSRAGRTIGGVLIVATAIGAWTIWNRNDAANDAMSEVEKVNNELATDAIDARDARARCRLAGGVWNFGATRCDEKPEVDRGD